MLPRIENESPNSLVAKRPRWFFGCLKGLPVRLYRMKRHRKCDGTTVDLGFLNGGRRLCFYWKRVGFGIGGDEIFSPPEIKFLANGVMEQRTKGQFSPLGSNPSAE